MAKKLSNIFFTSMKHAVRMQRKAMALAGVPGTTKRHKSTSGKSAAGKAARKPAARRSGAGKSTNDLTSASWALTSQMLKSMLPASGAPAVSRRGAKKSASRAKAPHKGGAAATGPAPGGKGTWKNCIYNSGPSATELLGRMAYSLYLPKDHVTTGLPLVIMLHGCKQTAQDMAAGTRMNRLADTKGFVVAYPQQARRVNTMRCWRWFEPAAGHGLAEADAIAGLTLDLARRLRLDRSRIYIAGLSAGAGMAALAALRHPDLYAAVAMHSGAVAGAAQNGSGGLKVMRHASEDDPVNLLAPLVAGASLSAAALISGAVSAASATAAASTALASSAASIAGAASSGRTTSLDGASSSEGAAPSNGATSRNGASSRNGESSSLPGSPPTSAATPGAALPLAGLPAIVIHGSRDRVVAARNAEQLAQQFSYLNGASAVRNSVLARGSHREYARQDYLKQGRPVVRLCMINEVGHAWSGGDSAVEFNSDKGPTASLLIWQFFAMHSRQDKVTARARPSPVARPAAA